MSTSLVSKLDRQFKQVPHALEDTVRQRLVSHDGRMDQISHILRQKAQMEQVLTLGDHLVIERAAVIIDASLPSTPAVLSDLVKSVEQFLLNNGIAAISR